MEKKMELITELPLELKTTNPSDISKPTSQSPRPNRRGFYGLDTKGLCPQSQKDYSTKESICQEGIPTLMDGVFLPISR